MVLVRLWLAKRIPVSELYSSVSLFYVDQFERKKEKYHDNPRFCSGIVAVLFLRIKLFNVPLFELIF